MDDEEKRRLFDQTRPRNLFFLLDVPNSTQQSKPSVPAPGHRSRDRDYRGRSSSAIGGLSFGEPQISISSRNKHRCPGTPPVKIRYLDRQPRACADISLFLTFSLERAQRILPTKLGKTPERTRPQIPSRLMMEQLTDSWSGRSEIGFTYIITASQLSLPCIFHVAHSLPSVYKNSIS